MEEFEGQYKRDLKTMRDTSPEIYTAEQTFDLGVARTNELLLIQGDMLVVTKITGTASIRFNELSAPLLSLNRLRKFRLPFFQVFITNTGQPSKELYLAAGRAAAYDFEIFGDKVQLLNALLAEINPATDENVAHLAEHELTTPSNGAVNVAATSTLVLAANADRRYAAFVNDSDTAIYLALGAAAVVNSGIRVNPSGGSYEINWLNRYKGAVYGIHAAVGNKVIGVVEAV